MSQSFTPLLLYPFEKGALPWPNSDQKLLFLHSDYMGDVTRFSQVDFYHPFQSCADVWLSKGHNPIEAGLNGKAIYDVVFCCLPKQKEQAMFLMAQAFSLLVEGGVFVGVAANDAGGKKIESWLQVLGVQTSSLPKQKAKIVWAKKVDYDKNSVQAYWEIGEARTISLGGETYVSQPGIFGWDKIDAGSQLLVQEIKDSLKGAGADFGAGYGYIARQILKTHKGIEKLYVIESNQQALMCAQENLKDYNKVEYRWTDIVVTQDLPTKLDFIVMNPPFHSDKAADISLGVDFIRKAALCLKKNGVLYMVANRHLPYEKTIVQYFIKADKLCEDKAFKIYKAIK